MSTESAARSGFTLDRAWQLDPQVSLRSERFGGLAYHFGTRRLSFLKTTKLLSVVQMLDNHSSAADACRAAGVEADELPAYERALSTLAQTSMISERARP